MTVPEIKNWLDALEKTFDTLGATPVYVKGDEITYHCLMQSIVVLRKVLGLPPRLFQ